MPTGYTAPVQDGEVTELKDFVRSVARGFGAFIHLRDSSGPLSYPAEPTDSYYQKAVGEDREALENWIRSSEEDKYAQWSDYYNRAKVEEARAEARKAEYRKNYQNMLAKVLEVDVDAKLQNLKDYMIEQLESSIKSDCYEGSWYKPTEYVEWCQSQDEGLRRRARRSQEEARDEWKRYYERCDYIDLLAKTYGLEIEK